MRWARWTLRASVLAIPALLLFVRPGGSQEAPGAIGFNPGQPVAGRQVLFTMSGASLAGSGYRWDFGDGVVTHNPAPFHVFSEPGIYNVGLTVETESGPVTIQRTVEVLSATTLRLNGGRFDVTMTARDQRTERTGVGQAIPENDLFGYFSIPDLTSQPDNPEMFVKILDARTVNGQFWVFYNGLTDLDVTLTVRENPTGIIKTYRKDPGSACGGFDTSGFIGGGGNPTATPPGPSATPTPTPPAQGGSQTINVDVFPFSYVPGSGATPIQVTAGVSTTLVLTSSSGTHGFSGIPELGVAGSNTISAGDDGDPYGGGSPARPHRVTFTAPESARGRSFPFWCTFDSCGTGHTGMTGVLRVN